jgi:hypothetical protein
VIPAAAASKSGTPDMAPPAPFTARWSAFTLSIDDQSLTAFARRFLGAIPDLDDLTFRAIPGELSLTIVVRRFGVPLSARASLSQIRFKDGFLAFVVDSVDALSFIPIPDALIGFLVEKAPPGLLTYYKADRILVARLEPWLPPGLDVALDRAEFGDHEVRFVVTPGTFDVRGLLGKPRG